jgi:hypothetical protein
MATPGTCAAQIREPASTIIEGEKAEGSRKLSGSEKTADQGRSIDRWPGISEVEDGQPFGGAWAVTVALEELVGQGWHVLGAVDDSYVDVFGVVGLVDGCEGVDQQGVAVIEDQFGELPGGLPGLFL